MQRQSDRTWTWVPFEIGILVVGILIAFGLNSWWESRSAAAREQAHLHALRSDFDQNLDRLEHLAEQHDRIAAASRELLLIAREDRSALSDSVDRLMSEVFNSARFEAVMGAYEGLVNSGGLTQIRDDSLRSVLATFASNLDSRYSEDFAMAMYIDFTRSFVGQLGWAKLAAGDVRGEQDDASDPPDASVTTWNHTLLEDPTFRDHLGMRSSMGAQLASEYRALAEQAAAVLDRVAASIDRSPAPPHDTINTSVDSAFPLSAEP